MSEQIAELEESGNVIYRPIGDRVHVPECTTDTDLTSFGNYLLSEEREELLINKHNRGVVTDADIANWKAQQNG